MAKKYGATDPTALAKDIVDVNNDDYIAQDAEHLSHKIKIDLTEIEAYSPKYTSEQIVQVAAYYVVTGNMSRVSKLLGIPDKTLYRWVKEPWWEPLVKKVRDAKQDELDGRLTQVITQGVEGLLDRIENGDVKIVQGEQVRVPMDATVLSRVVGTMYDKRALLRGDPTSRTESKDSPEHIIKVLESKFSEMANKHLPKAIDAEVITEENNG